MKNCLGYIVLCMAFLSGCNSEVKKDEFVGVWVNEKEKCEIQLNRDLTFQSTNLPLDVENKNYITFDKQTKTWQGVWSLEEKQLKLTINDSYYYLGVNKTFLSSEHRLYVKLLEETGGEMIYFDKQ